MFSKEWQAVWDELVKMNLFGEGASETFKNVKPSEFSSCLVPIGEAFGQHIHAFFRSLLEAHPWLAKVLNKKTKTFPWPAQIPDAKIEWTEKIDWADQCFLQTKAVDMMVAEAMADCKEIACLPWLLEVGRARHQLFAAWKIKPLHQTKSVAAKTLLLKNFFDRVGSAIAHAELAPKKLVEPLIRLEQDTGVQKFKELLCAMLDSIAILASTAGDLADDVNLSLAKHWDSGGNDGAGILTVLNSQHAQVLREAWTPLINEKNAITFLLTQLIAEKYGFLNDAIAKVKEEKPFAEMDKNFERVRDKVCELSAAKAFSRPLRQSETRSEVVKVALETVEKLEGILPPKLALLISELLK